MALDSAALPTDAEAPIVDTPDASTENTAENTPPPQPVDWEARYKAAQSEITRITQARARERVAASADPEDDEAEDTDEAPTPRPNGRQSAALRQALERNEILERQVAESVHGPEIVAAYDQWVDVWNGTETESDRVTALLAFAESLRGSPPAPPAPAGAQPPSRAQALQPRVDQNQPDAPALATLDTKNFEGGKNGGSRAFFRQLLGGDPPRG